MLCIGSFAELKELAKDPSLIGAEFDPHRPIVDDIVLVKDGEEYVHEPYVLDVWFDSGAMQYASGRAALGEVPADYIAEAVDQTRGWFYTLLALSTIIDERPAYKNVVCMGHLVDETGKKMSKSLGNVFNPWETFKVLGVDAIRWYFYTVNSPGEAKAFSYKEVQTSFRKTHLLYWNVFNYFVTYATVAGFAPPSDEVRVTLHAQAMVNGEKIPLLDQWILSRQAAVRDEVTSQLDVYDFMRAGRALEAYVTELSTWYLRRSRKRSDQAFFTVLYDVLMNVSALLAPFTPFMTEYVYRTLKTESAPASVHLTEWPAVFSDRNEALENTMKNVQAAVELGLRVRAEEKVKVRQPLQTAALVGFTVEEEELRGILAEELNVLEVTSMNSLEAGYAWTGDAQTLAVGLDLTMTDALQVAGDARELLRLIQNMRKSTGLQPGQLAHLEVAPQHRESVETLLQAMPSINSDAFLVVDDATWNANPLEEISVNGETIALALRAL